MKTKLGKQCNANAMIGDNFCFAHNPKTKQQHKLSTAKGGKANAERNPIKEIDLTTPEKILELISDTINRVRKVDKNGCLDVKTANCIAILSGKLMEAQKLVKYKNRLKELEEIVKKNNLEAEDAELNDDDWKAILKRNRQERKSHV